MAPPSLKLDAIFLEAVELTDDTARAEYLDRACGDDFDLRLQVEQLLQVDSEAGSFLDQPAYSSPTEPSGTTVGTEASMGAAADPNGQFVGPYKLLKILGEGGMGIVYLAEQERPIRRQVAVKTIKPGMDSREVITRFEAERQALALMDHPHIARVFDAGVTRDGDRPYFVMERVQGLPITTYCDQKQLTLRERMALFVLVCKAVQHAHQKGIIHRDLKPTNVLVAEQDGDAVPKVIDFGVAKALGQSLTEQTLATGFGRIVGTLEYMSPEQADFNAVDIDTRADIYSLGVLLYELLTGSTPVTKKRFQETSGSALLRTIREVEPPRPSARLTDSSEPLESIGAQRRLTPVRLAKELRGELDWIVMRALEKDRNRRYATASGLALDVEHYLAGEPVWACPPSTAYRLRKVARRHWRAIAVATTFLATLLVGIGALSMAYIALVRERGEKEAALLAEGKRRKQAQSALDAMSSVIVDDLLAKQSTLQPEHETFLKQALGYYEEFAAETDDHEESRAGVANAYARVGSIQARLGRLPEAEAAWERGRQLYADLVTDFPKSAAHRNGLARIHVTMSGLYQSTGRKDEAEGALLTALKIYRLVNSDYPDNPAYRQALVKTLVRQGVLLKNIDRPREAEQAYEEALRFQKQLVAESPSEEGYRFDLGQIYLNLGLLLDLLTDGSHAADDMDAGRSNDAESASAEAVSIYEKLSAEYPRNASYRDQLATSLNNLGHVQLNAGQDARAKETFEKAITSRMTLVSDYPGVPQYRRGLAMTLNNLGIVLKNMGRGHDAEEQYRRAMEIQKQLAADFPKVPDHQSETAGAMTNVARVLLDRKDFGGARLLLEQARRYHQTALAANPNHPDYRNFYRLNRWRLAETCLGLHDHAAAAAAVEQFLEANVDPPRDSYTAACLLAGCVSLADQDQDLDAEKRRQLVTTYGDRALVALHSAIDQGAAEITTMDADPSLDPLRQREDFPTQPVPGKQTGAQE